MPVAVLELIGRVESCAVVAHAEGEDSSLVAALYPHVAGASVPHGVDAQLADNAQYVVRHRVGEARARDLEADRHLRAVCMWRNRLFDGFLEVLLLQRLAAQVPEAAAQFFAA